MVIHHVLAVNAGRKARKPSQKILAGSRDGRRKDCVDETVERVSDNVCIIQMSENGGEKMNDSGADDEALIADAMPSQ